MYAECQEQWQKLQLMRWEKLEESTSNFMLEYYVCAYIWEKAKSHGCRMWMARMEKNDYEYVFMK